MKPRPVPKSAALRDCAEAQSKAKAGPDQLQGEADLQRLQQELEVHQIELERQSEELRAAQAATATALEQYSDHFDFAPVGFFTLTADGTIRDVNLKGAGLLGLERAQLPGQRFGLFVVEVDRGDFADFLTRVFETGTVQTCELALVRQFQPALAGRLEATRSPDGKECRAVLIDITERKRTEEVLQESEARFRDLFENANDLIQSVAPDGKFIYVNRAWREALGYTQEELARLTLLDVLDPSCRTHCQEMFRRLVRGETIPHVETVFIDKRGQRITVEGNINCRLKDGQVVATRGIFRDITERKRAEALERERGQLMALEPVMHFLGIRI